MIPGQEVVREIRVCGSGDGSEEGAGREGRGSWGGRYAYPFPLVPHQGKRDHSAEKSARSIRVRLQNPDRGWALSREKRVTGNKLRSLSLFALSGEGGVLDDLQSRMRLREYDIRSGVQRRSSAGR